jgi:hypothetical protein
VSKSLDCFIRDCAWDATVGSGIDAEVAPNFPPQDVVEDFKAKMATNGETCDWYKMMDFAIAWRRNLQKMQQP